MPTHRQSQEASTQGRAWAEKKADMLDEVSAASWPDEWDPAWNGTLDLPSGELAEAERAELVELATQAATERWVDLLVERHELENDRANAEDLERQATKVLEQIRTHLPEGLSAAREGSRVYVLDSVTGRDRTITSLEDAWRVVQEWQEERDRL